jgi:hypothetical protein
MKRFVFLMFAVFFLAYSSPASAGTITFDPFPSIPGDVTVQYFDGGLTGPLSALPVTNGAALISTPSAIPGGGNALQTWQGSNGPWGVLFTFANLQKTVSAVGNDFGGDSVSDNERVYLTAFNAAGGVIGSATVNDPWATPNLQPVSFTSLGTDIRYVAFTWENDLGYYAVDNIGYTSVPLPASVWLLNSSLLGLAGLRRFWKI